MNEVLVTVGSGLRMDELEAHLLAMLLRGEDTMLSCLRQQAASCTVTTRKFTGVGFFTNFAVPPDVSRALNGGRIRIGDVYAQIEGLQHNAGFFLLVEQGAIRELECFTHGEPWPDDARLVRAYYVRPSAADSGSLIESPTRDLRWALSGVA